MIRSRRYVLPRVPRVFYYVTGRKMWAKNIPPKIRAMWKVGNYGGMRVHN